MQQKQKSAKEQKLAGKKNNGKKTEIGKTNRICQKQSLEKTEIGKKRENKLIRRKKLAKLRKSIRDGFRKEIRFFRTLN